MQRPKTSQRSQKPRQGDQLTDRRYTKSRSVGQFPRTIHPRTIPHGQFPLPFWVGHSPNNPPDILCKHTYTCMRTHTYTYIHTYTHTYTHIHTHIHIHTYIYIHTYACIQIHAYIDI